MRDLKWCQWVLVIVILVVLNLGLTNYCGVLVLHVHTGTYIGQDPYPLPPDEGQDGRTAAAE